jgi:hypothetical protein
MNKSIFKLSLGSFVGILLLCFASPTLAHGGEPRIEISADRLNPGGALDLRGVDFEFEEQITLDLVSQETVIPFGTVLADAEGIFLLTITLPADVAEGTYVMRATTDDHIVESAPITISGSADSEEGEQRELEEPLLAPMPTAVEGVSTAVPFSVPSTESTTKPTSSAPFVWIVIAIGIVVIASLLLRMRR